MKGRRGFGRAHPDLAELVVLLEFHGVERGGAAEIVQAVAVGADWYVCALADDDAAWKRFRVAFEVVTGKGSGEVSPDSVTVGALAWAVLQGSAFTQAVVDRITGSAEHARSPATPLH